MSSIDREQVDHLYNSPAIQSLATRCQDGSVEGDIFKIVQQICENTDGDLFQDVPRPMIGELTRRLKQLVPKSTKSGPKYAGYTVDRSQLPTPLKNLLDLYDSETVGLRKVHRLIDLFEWVIKWHTVVVVSDILREKQLSDEMKVLFSAALQTPSLGHWFRIFRDVLRTLENPLLDWNSMQSLLDVDKELERSQHAPIVQFRNGYAHGATRSDELCMQDCDVYYPILEKIICMPIFTELQLVFDDGSGPKRRVGGMEYPSSIAVVERHIYVVSKNDPDQEFLDLWPLAIATFPDEQGSQREFFYFNAMRSKAIDQLNYEQAIHIREHELWENFHQRLPLRDWRTVSTPELDRFREKIEQLTDLFKGRKNEIAKLHEFCKSANGTMMVWGDPGSGKSALLAKVVSEIQIGHSDHCAELPNVNTIHYFLRRGESQTDTIAFLEHVSKRLDNLYHLKDMPSAITVAEWDEALRKRLQSIKDLPAKEQKRLILIVDGLDESLQDHTGHGAEDLLRYIPIPAHYKFLSMICASRRVDTIEQWSKRRDIEESIMMGTLEKEDVRALLYEVVDKYDHRLTDDYIKTILDRSEGSPLFVKVLCEQLFRKELELGDVDRIPKKIEDMYALTVTRLTDSGQNDPMVKLLMLLSIAKSRVSVELVADVLEINDLRADHLIQRAMEWLSEDKNDHVQFFHETVREFMTQKYARECRKMQRSLRGIFSEWADLEGHSRQYVLQFASQHLVEERKDNELWTLLQDADFRRAQIVDTQQYQWASNTLTDGIAFYSSQEAGSVRSTERLEWTMLEWGRLSEEHHSQLEMWLDAFATGTLSVEDMLSNIQSFGPDEHFKICVQMMLLKSHRAIQRHRTVETEIFEPIVKASIQHRTKNNVSVLCDSLLAPEFIQYWLDAVWTVCPDIHLFRLFQWRDKNVRDAVVEYAVERCLNETHSSMAQDILTTITLEERADVYLYVSGQFKIHQYLVQSVPDEAQKMADVLHSTMQNLPENLWIYGHIGLLWFHLNLGNDEQSQQIQSAIDQHIAELFPVLKVDILKELANVYKNVGDKHRVRNCCIQMIRWNSTSVYYMSIEHVLYHYTFEWPEIAMDVIAEIPMSEIRKRLQKRLWEHHLPLADFSTLNGIIERLDDSQDATLSWLEQLMQAEEMDAEHLQQVLNRLPIKINWRFIQVLTTLLKMTLNETCTAIIKEYCERTDLLQQMENSPNKLKLPDISPRFRELTEQEKVYKKLNAAIADAKQFHTEGRHTEYLKSIEQVVFDLHANFKVHNIEHVEFSLDERSVSGINQLIEFKSFINLLIQSGEVPRATSLLKYLGTQRQQESVLTDAALYYLHRNQLTKFETMRDKITSWIGKIDVYKQWLQFLWDKGGDNKSQQIANVFMEVCRFARLYDGESDRLSNEPTQCRTLMDWALKIERVDLAELVLDSVNMNNEIEDPFVVLGEWCLQHGDISTAKRVAIRIENTVSRTHLFAQIVASLPESQNKPVVHALWELSINFTGQINLEEQRIRCLLYLCTIFEKNRRFDVVDNILEHITSVECSEDLMRKSIKQGLLNQISQGQAGDVREQLAQLDQQYHSSDVLVALSKYYCAQPDFENISGVYLYPSHRIAGYLRQHDLESAVAVFRTGPDLDKLLQILEYQIQNPAKSRYRMQDLISLDPNQPDGIDAELPTTILYHVISLYQNHGLLDTVSELLSLFEEENYARYGHIDSWDLRTLAHWRYELGDIEGYQHCINDMHTMATQVHDPSEPYSNDGQWISLAKIQWTHGDQKGALDSLSHIEHNDDRLELLCNLHLEDGHREKCSALLPEITNKNIVANFQYRLHTLEQQHLEAAQALFVIPVSSKKHEMLAESVAQMADKNQIEIVLGQMIQELPQLSLKDQVNSIVRMLNSTSADMHSNILRRAIPQSKQEVEFYRWLCHTMNNSILIANVGAIFQTLPFNMECVRTVLLYWIAALFHEGDSEKALAMVRQCPELDVGILLDVGI